MSPLPRLEARALYAAHRVGVRDRIEVLNVSATSVCVTATPGLTSAQGKRLLLICGVQDAHREVVGTSARWSGWTPGGDLINVLTRPVTTTHRSHR